MNIRVFVSMQRKQTTHYIKHNELDAGDHQLIIDFGSYELKDKKIYIGFKPRAYLTEVQPDHGLVFIPLKDIMLKDGFNIIQATFEDKAGNVEKSPVIEWEVKKTSLQDAI